MIDDAKFSMVLSEFARTVIRDAPVQGILDRLVGGITDVLPVTSAGVTLISDTMEPHYIAASNDAALQYERLQTSLKEGPCLLAYQSREPVLIPELAAECGFPQFQPAALEAGLRAVFTFPLRYERSCLGALDLYGEQPGPLDPQQIVAAQTLADVAAAFVLNAQSREEVRTAFERFRHHALHDQLTGLPNRLNIQELLEKAVQSARQSYSNAALVFVNIDRFRQVNETYGHATGDELLIGVARRLSRLVGSDRTLARVGSDSFVILCEDVYNIAEVGVLTQNILNAFAEPFVIRGKQVAVAIRVDMTNAVGSEYALGYFYSHE